MIETGLCDPLVLNELNSSSVTKPRNKERLIQVHNNISLIFFLEADHEFSSRKISRDERNISHTIEKATTSRLILTVKTAGPAWARWTFLKVQLSN